MSHPLRVRGLKLFYKISIYIIQWSHPLRVRGLKHGCKIGMKEKDTSHPLRVRGLKPLYLTHINNK